MTSYRNFSLKLRYAMIPVILVLTMYPSEPPAPCSGQNNPYLLQNLQSAEFTLPRYNSEDVWGKTGAKEGAWELWATSTLTAEGKPPKIIADGPDALESQGKNYTWSCMFSVGSLIDKKTDTAWSEAVEGDGIGQAVLFPVKYFPRGKRKTATLKIFNGYGKSQRIWKNNNRVKDLVLHIASAQAGGIETWTSYSQIKSHCKVPLQLKDQFGYQKITVPLEGCNWNVQISKEDREMGIEIKEALVIGIEIVSVYPGDKYKDTLISEADFY
ncbi:MAG TPA: hypothetical protein PLF85_15010 [Turneriella sp.]|nr:hypothetical protein [Turneriella sp.]